MIIHAGGYFVDRILQATQSHSIRWTGQRRAAAAEVVVIVLEARRPMRRKRPFDTGAGRPAGTGHGRIGIDGNSTDIGEGIVHLLARPSSATPDENEPAVGKTVAEQRGG